MIFGEYEVYFSVLEEELVLSHEGCPWEERFGVSSTTVLEIILQSGQHWIKEHLEEEEKDEEPEGPDGRQVQKIRIHHPGPLDPPDLHNYPC